MASPAPYSRIRFGEFEADLAAGELCKDGLSRKILLSDQPLEILRALVARPGEMVSREELVQLLWKGNTNVDFDPSLNKAVNRLRESLGDSAEAPRYIETLSRRGYRFIAPVNSGEGLKRTQFTAPGRRLVLTAAVTILVVFAAAGGWYWRSRQEKLTEKDTIVLADFRNTTGDSVFDDTLKQGLRVQLEQSPFLNVLSDQNVSEKLRLMGRSSDERLTPEIARDLCQRVSSKAVLAGSISMLGSHYVIALNALNCLTGDALASEQVEVDNRERVLKALSDSATNVRKKLGESLATIQKFDVPLADATTPSLEALKAYSLGIKAGREKSPAVSLSHSQRAIELDPDFAMGYWSVGTAYYSMNEIGRSSEYLTKAFELRQHTSEREKLILTADYETLVTGDLNNAVKAYQEQIESYPRDWRPYNWLGLSLAAQGQYEKAVEAYPQSTRLNPVNLAPYCNLANSLVALRRFSDAGQTIQEAEARKLDAYYFHDLLYAMSFFASDAASMTEQQKWFSGRPEENIELSLASDTEAYSGHLGKARELTKKSVESAIRADSKESGAVWLENASLREAAFGKFVEAKRAAADGTKLTPASKGVGVEAALAYAMAGDTDRAGSLWQELNRRFPVDTQIQSLWLPAVRAQLALNRKKPREALDDLQAASGPIEFGQIPFTVNTSCLYPTYLRGEAYLAAGEAVAASNEYQKIVDHNGIVWNCWTGALAHLGVARANALRAKTSQGAEAHSARERALAAYKEFLALWKDADLDLPILKEAKAEYAKLQ